MSNDNKTQNSFNLLGKLGRVRANALRILAESVGLHLAQPPILHLLSEETNLTQNEIASRLSLTQASVTMNLARMEKSGLIYKSPDEEDGRKLRIQSTSLGTKRYAEIEKLQSQFEEEVMFKDFSHGEKKAFLEGVCRIITNIENANR